MKHLAYGGAILATALSMASTSSAQPPPSASPPVTLVLDLPADATIDNQRLKEAIERELGAPVVWERGAAGGTLVVRAEGHEVVVSFEAPGGRRDGRRLPLEGDPRHEERDIALLAGNVARDQTSQFATPPTPTELPTPAPRAPLPPAPSPPPQCSGERLVLPAALDLAPWVGVSSFDRGRSARVLSLGALGGLSGGVDGLALSGGVDLARGAVCGGQIAGAANVAERVTGGQIAGGVNVAGEVEGGQIAGAANVAKRLAGVQIAGAMNVAEGVAGWQTAGGLNLARDDSAGVQLAPVNVSVGRIRGVQIGVFNYARSADFQLGLVNVTSDARLHADVWTNPEMGLAVAGLKETVGHFQWIYAVGIRPIDPSRPWAIIGTGAHLTPSEHWYVDLDALMQTQLVFQSWQTAFAPEARAIVGYHLLPWFGVFVGPTFNLLVEGLAAHGGAPSYASEVARTSSTTFQVWPGAALGVELL